MLAMKSEQGIIRKSNELIEARYRLSLSEQRLVLLLTSQISPQDASFKDYELKVSNFIEMFNLDNDKGIYEKVEHAAEQLLSRVITLKDGSETEKTTWLSYVQYVKGSGIVKIRFDKSLMPYLLQLKGRFTQYNICHVVSFRSQYSIRLYEILKMDAYKAQNGKIDKSISLKELREMLGIAKKEYSAFDNFRRRVIEPAIKEISNQTDLAINGFSYIKTGRKITGITFHVIIGSNKKIDSEDKPELGYTPIVDTLVGLGFSAKVAQQYDKKYSTERLERNIAYAQAKQDKGAVKDFPAYLNKAIVEDMAGAWEQAQAKVQAQQEEKAQKSKQREHQLELDHLKMMAEKAGVPLETLLPKKGGDKTANSSS